jgi:hypothetical protein
MPGAVHNTLGVTRDQIQDEKKDEVVDHLPPNVESIPEGVEDCTLKDMIPIKNRFSNLHAYPGKTRNQKNLNHYFKKICNCQEK